MSDKISDKGSQNGSIRAGYRRSRVEAVDPATISAPPPNAPSPNNQVRPASVSSTKKEENKGEGILKKILRGIFLLLNMIFMTFAIMMIIFGAILWTIFREAGLSIIDVADGAPLILILNGIFLAIFAMWGCEIALISGRVKTILYLIGLCIMFGFSIFAFVRSRNLAESIKDNLIEHWGTFSTTTRSMIQDFGYCCGLNGPIDYPALPCPEGTRKGCLQGFNDMQHSVKKTADGFLGGSTFSFLLIAGVAAYLGFTGEKEKGPKNDLESSGSSSDSVPKEDISKAEVHSQI